MRGSYATLSLLLGVLVGVVVAGFIGSVTRVSGAANIGEFISNGFTFWGYVFGVPAALAVAGLVFAMLNRGERKAYRVGSVFAGIVLTVFAAATFWWIAMWGFPSPFTLEGWWVYTLAVAAATAAFLLLRRRQPERWDQPRD